MENKVLVQIEMENGGKIDLELYPDVAPEIYKREDVTLISKSSKKDND